MDFINDFTKVVEPDFDSVNLGYWLKKKFPNYSYELFCKLLRKGAIRVNSSRVKITKKLKPNDIIKVPRILVISNFKKNERFISNEQINKIKKSIIFRNENFFLINKFSGLPVQGGVNIKFSIDQVLKYLKFDNNEKPKLVHRIDRDTSGLLIISRKLKYAKYLTDLFRKRNIIKNYLAICVGNLKYSNGIIKKPIKIKKRTYDAETHFQVLDRTKNFFLVALKPITGRKHQIRNHLFCLNCPILGDQKFSNEFKKGLLKGLKNQLNLHSYYLEFNDQDGKKLFFCANPPKSMETTMSNLNLSFKKFDNNIFSNVNNWPIIK